jgi:hypothetical protein
LEDAGAKMLDAPVMLLFSMSQTGIKGGAPAVTIPAQ